MNGLLDELAIYASTLTEATNRGITMPLACPRLPATQTGMAKSTVPTSQSLPATGNMVSTWKTPDATWEMGDFNGDGVVDGSDVTILAGNWQYGVDTQRVQPFRNQARWGY